MKFLNCSLIIALGVTVSISADCDECKKLRDEVTKAWKMNIEMTKEVRALTQELLKHSDTIRRLHNN